MNIPQQPVKRRGRLVSRGDDDGLEIVRTGHRKLRLGDMYIRLLAASWKQLLCLIVALYLGINLLFALAYLAIGGIEHAQPGSFADAFFFSVQTLSTIGFGRMAPVGLVANVLVTLEALTGFGFFALVTGLVFSKFSRPTARVLFSEVAVICPYDGVPHLMLRLANERSNRIVDANLHMVMLRKEVTQEGHQMRRFHDLKLVRSRIPILQLTWTAMHRIDGESPLHNATPLALRDIEAEIVVSLTGLDETLSQTIHARTSYVAEEIICGSAFVDILKRSDDGRVEVNYNLFHEVRPLAKN